MTAALDGSSSVTVGHQLGVAPRIVTITKLWTASSNWQRSTFTITARSSSDYTAQFLDPNGSFMSGVTASFMWSAIA